MPYIICSDSPDFSHSYDYHKLYEAGMDTLRFNVSYCDYENTETVIDFIQETLPDVGIFLDLQGIKIRVSNILQGDLRIHKDQQVWFIDANRYGDPERNASPHPMIPVACEAAFSTLTPSEHVLMKDGAARFEVVERQQDRLLAKAMQGTLVRALNSVNFPGMSTDDLQLTQKDKRDILWGLSKQVDHICLSFASTREQVRSFRAFVHEHRKDQDKLPTVWAKIETLKGAENVREILEEVDAILLGRGDLGAEAGIKEVPMIQENVLQVVDNFNRQHKEHKDIVIATHVLQSMIRDKTPSRSEVNDIYRCLKNGASGFMLTAETSVGMHPFLATRTLKSLCDYYAG